MKMKNRIMGQFAAGTLAALLVLVTAWEAQALKIRCSIHYNDDGICSHTFCYDADNYGPTWGYWVFRGWCVD